jgi:hypothetical protein
MICGLEMEAVGCCGSTSLEIILDDVFVALFLLLLMPLLQFALRVS